MRRESISLFLVPTVAADVLHDRLLARPNRFLQRGRSNMRTYVGIQFYLEITLTSKDCVFSPRWLVNELIDSSNLMWTCRVCWSVDRCVHRWNCDRIHPQYSPGCLEASHAQALWMPWCQCRGRSSTLLCFVSKHESPQCRPRTSS